MKTIIDALVTAANLAHKVKDTGDYHLSVAADRTLSKINTACDKLIEMHEEGKR